MPLALLAAAVIAVAGLTGGVRGVWELLAPSAPVPRVASPAGVGPETPAIPRRR